METVNSVADKTTKSYPVGSLAIILVLVLIILYLSFRKEKFNPTSTMYKVTQDQQHVGWSASENRERAEGGPAKAGGPKEGSPSWNVLHSDDFGCDKREPVGDDAWSWMVGHSKDAESMKGNRGGRLTDSDLSKRLAAK
jgi:hypothetical protein